jgi:hypothetical protein
MRVYGMQPDIGCPLPYQVRDKFREHDEQEVIPAHAGIQEPYRQSQAALEERSEWREELRRLVLTPALRPGNDVVNFEAATGHTPVT